MIEERILTDADCEKIADLLVPKLKASILGDMHREAGKGLFSLAWKAALIVMVWLAVYNMTGGFNFRQVVAKPQPELNRTLREFRVLPPAKDNPRLTQLAEQLDRKIGRGG